MTHEQQRTFGPVVGMESVVPTRPHPDDDVECSDGTIHKHCDVVYDVRGGAHSNDEDCFEAEVEIVRDILKAHEKWVDEYTDGSHNNDYADGYAYVVWETKLNWRKSVEDWLYKVLPHCVESDFRKLANEIINSSDECDLEPSYTSSDYAAYTGPGICVDSLEVGEYEDQIELSSHDELVELDQLCRLERILGELDGEFCLDQSSRYCKLSERRVYGDYVQHGTITVTFAPGGQWHYVVPEETAQQRLTAAIVAICRRAVR